MNLEEIREQIAHQLTYDVELWSDVLNNTEPGNYGLNDWDFQLNEDKFYVDIPNKTFRFSDSTFSADVILGASRGDHSFDESFSSEASGNGTFDFVDKDTVKITDWNFDVNTDIYSED